ncbi:unnamed protein product [Paramecium octaurelia]|uniref:Uncharacterized protein n=1 Tax=Paramecium octaurelia TaxID=43137 RepID=A0A8S1TFK1_PAROT|nr:unnamed protein product [Paramecium octaurelia]
MEELKDSDLNQNNHLRIDTQPHQQECNQFLSNYCDFQSPLKTEQSNLEIKPKKEVYTNEEMKKFTKQGIVSLVGGVLIHIELGTFYVWASISPYVAAWMRIKDTTITHTSMSAVYPILGIITMSFLSFGIKIAERVGFKFIIGCGSFILALAFLIISFVQDIQVFIAIYCIMVGISGGLLHMLPIICGLRYFPNKSGLVSGVIIGGYGFGSFIFNFVCKAIANPNNVQPSVEVIEDGKVVLYFDSEVGEKVPFMFQVLAISYLGLGIIGTLMIRYPKDIDPDKMLTTLEALQPKKNKQFEDQLPTCIIPNRKECQSVTNGIKSKPFILLQLIVLMSCTLGMMISNCYKFYGFELGFNDSLLTVLGSVGGVMNGSSRFFWVTLTEKTSFKFTFTIISFLNLASSSILPYNTSGIGYLLIIGVIYLAEGGLLAIYPVVCAKIFGKKVGGVINYFMYFMVGVSNMIGYILYAFVRNRIGWEGIFWVCFAINTLGIILGLFLKESGYDWQDPQIRLKVQSGLQMQDNNKQ